jgi:inner membrane protein
MDNLTHSLIGAAVANAGLKQKLGRGTTWALIISSNIPDIDVFWGFVDPAPSFAYRRMLTHGILGVPLLCLAGAALHRRFFPNLTFKTCFLLYLLGTVLHVLFDLANSFGVVVLYPFSRHRFELSWLFIIDFALWFLLLSPLVLSLFKSRWTGLRDLSRVAAKCVLIYVLVCAALHLRSERSLRRYTEDAGIKPSFSYVFPEALGPQRFRGVIREGDRYRIFQINSITGELAEFGHVDTHDGDADVKRIVETKEGKILEWFAKAPVWTPVPGGPAGGQRWGAQDLRFGSTVIHRGNPFVFGFDVVGNDVRYLGRLNAAPSS